MDNLTNLFDNMSVNNKINNLYIDTSYNNDMIYNKNELIKALIEENGISYNEALAICIENDIY